LLVQEKIRLLISCRRRGVWVPKKESDTDQGRNGPKKRQKIPGGGLTGQVRNIGRGHRLYGNVVLRRSAWGPKKCIREKRASEGGGERRRGLGKKEISSPDYRQNYRDDASTRVAKRKPRRSLGKDSTSRGERRKM